LKPPREPADKQDDSAALNLSLDKLDIWVYRRSYHRIAMSAMTDAGYLDVLHMDFRNHDFCLPIGRKKKLDSQKRGLLSFSEIAVERAP